MNCNQLPGLYLNTSQVRMRGPWEAHKKKQSQQDRERIRLHRCCQQCAASEGAAENPKKPQPRNPWSSSTSRRPRPAPSRTCWTAWTVLWRMRGGGGGIFCDNLAVLQHSAVCRKQRRGRATGVRKSSAEAAHSAACKYLRSVADTSRAASGPAGNGGVPEGPLD